MDIQQAIKPIALLHKGLMLVFSLVLAGGLFLVNGKIMLPILSEQQDRLFQVIAVALSGAFLFIGFKLFNKTVLKIRNSDASDGQKIMQYRAASIVWYAMIEGPGLFAMVCYIITGNIAFFILALVHLFVLFLFMPKAQVLSLLLNLKNQQ
ncbi:MULTISPECIES: hypothetical protein [unclassified Paraflavitalea]|uniref:hypothetical protein n=1 Tax=unclassified Paraflavitalea TaxID=2798305 RepID=UPI003D324C35